MSHHRGAALTIAGALALDALAGLAYALCERIPAGYGLYWAVQTATTVGYGDFPPRNTAGYVISAVVMLTVVPLFGASFSLFTSGLTAGHVSRSEARIKAHVTALNKGGDPGG